MKKSFLALCLMVLTAPAALAADIPEVVTKAAAMVSTQPPDSVRPGPMEGYYELAFGARVVYVSADGRYLLLGQVFDTQAMANLTEQRREALRLEMLAATGRDTMIRFAPDDPKHEVYVFTDTHCGYCRKLHDEVPELNELGVAVNYLAYPAISPRSRPDAVSVWCADDQQQAMTRAKAGESIDDRQCDNPVDAHFALGKDLGVRGTPAIITDSGEMLPGYVPARQLVRQLDQKGR